MTETAFAEYETSKIWSNFRESFLSHNSQINLKYLVELAACDLADPQESYFVPGSRKGQIVICYNKVRDQAHFNQLLTYNVPETRFSWCSPTITSWTLRPIGTIIDSLPAQQ